MKARTPSLIGLALLLTPLFQLQAQIPGTLSYQAYLSDSLGIPKADDRYEFTFRLYDADIGGAVLWTETKELDVKQGLFHTYMGDVEPFPDSLRFDRPYWLGIQVGSEPELAPRVALTSVGYSFSALRADSAQYATRADTAQYVINAPSPTGPAGGDLSGTYPDPIIADGAVTSEKIADGTIQGVDVAGSFTAPYADTSDYADTSHYALSAPPSGSAGGDLSGEYPNPVLATGVVSMVNIDITGALDGQAIMFDGSQVVWDTPPNPGGTITEVAAGAGLIGGGAVGNVTLSAAFASNGIIDTVARSDHVHGGEDIASGTLAEAFIDPAIARDDEIMGTVLAGDGSGSELNADSLDGLDASDFAAAAHTHGGSDITSAVGVADSAAKAPWSGITDIPTGFADGVDDTGGDAHSLDAADSDPVDAVYVDNTGNVGVGTTSPVYPLHVSDTVTTSAYPADVMAVEVIPDGTTMDGFGPAIMFQVGEPGTVGEMARIASVYENQGNSSGLAFYTYASRSLTEGVRIDRYGNVGIGTPTPASKLEVSGTVTTNSLTTSGDAAVGGSLTASALNVSGTATADSLATSGNATVGGSLTANTLNVSGTATADSLETSSGASIGGTLVIGGGQAVKVDSVTNGYVTTASDRIILYVPEGGQSEVITLQPAADVPGQLLSIRMKRMGSSDYVTIEPSTGDFIDGTVSSFTLGCGGECPLGINLVSDGTDWWIISLMGWYFY